MQIPELPNLIHYAIPFFILTVILEIILTVKVKLEDYDFKDATTSVLMGLGNVFLGFLSKAMVLTLFLFLYNYRIFTIYFTWWSWILILFAEDFTYYWFHRISHESRLFWASHVVHHSSKKYNLSTDLRQTWSGSFYSFIFWLPLILVGFHPIMVMVQMSISLIYQYWIHTELINKLPKWFEAIFNTPSHHRVHHATNPQYLDRNHAGIFIIWDKLFKTFEAEVEKTAIEQLYYNLIKGGVYTTKAEGKFKHMVENKKANFDYVTVPYNSINDEEVKVSDDEIIAFMKKNAKPF